MLQIHKKPESKPKQAGAVRTAHMCMTNVHSCDREYSTEQL